MYLKSLLIVAAMLVPAPAFSQSIFDDPAAKAGPQQPAQTPSAPTSDIAAAPPASASLAPVPDSAAQKAADAVLRQAIGEEIAAAKTPDQLKAVAHKLLDVANGESGAKQYLLLIKARDLAIRAGDLENCDSALTALGAAFAVDLPKQRLEAYTKLATALSPADRAAFCGAVSVSVQSTLAADELEVARATAELGLQAAHKANDPELMKQATADVDAVRVRTTAYTGIKVALATLLQQPKDPEANLKVGKYRCFLKGDWQTGLPMLALGGDAKLKVLAETELAGVTSDDDQVKLGDGWWTVAQTQAGLAKQNIAAHAATWYEQAAPGLTGLKKIALEKRIEEIQKLAATSQEVVLIEAFIDGNSELHVTSSGIYWVEKGASKPGMHSGAHLPTYVNGKEWWPKWGKPNEEKGDDQTEPLRLSIGNGDLNYEVVAITEQRDQKGIADRDAVTLKKSGKESVLSIPDGQVGAMWYTLRVSKNRMIQLTPRFVGEWHYGDRTFTLNADGSATTSADDNTGTWGANPEGTAVQVRWKKAGKVHIYKLEAGRWKILRYGDGILLETADITAP